LADSLDLDRAPVLKGLLLVVAAHTASRDSAIVAEAGVCSVSELRWQVQQTWFGSFHGSGPRVGRAAMTEPAMLVLDDVPEELDELRGALRRYGQEYVVICESSAAAASDRLARLAADGRPVAIVCAPAAMIDTGGGEFLAMAHRLNPPPSGS
jgi:hypothetical protein